MGHLRDHKVGQLRHRFGLRHFVETGTWNGDGTAHAALLPWETITTVDVDPSALERARAKLDNIKSHNTKVYYVTGDSAGCVPLILDGLPVPALWWLDAHLPERYDCRGKGERFPLLDEVGAIVQHSRPHAGDVIIMDDLRLYKRGPFADGNFDGPVLTQAYLTLQRLLAPTHQLVEDYRSTGYLVATPLETPCGT